MEHRNQVSYQNDKVSSGKLCLLLLKNRFMAQLGINVFRYEKDARKRNSKIGVTVALGICILVLMFYCGAMAFGYGFLGLTELIPGISLVITSLITLFFTMFKANGELFGFRDYDMVISLPIPVSIVIQSRILNMYLWNTLISAMVMIPMGIVYGIFARPSLGTILMLIFGIFLASLIPTTLAAVFGGIITAISSKFRYASTMSTILSIGFVVGFMVISMTLPTNSSAFGNFIDPNTGEFNQEAFSSFVPLVSETLNQIYPPVKLFSEGLLQGKITSFLLFAGISIIWYGLFVVVLSLKYKQINTALVSKHQRADYKIQTLHQGSMVVALYKKTTLRILKSTISATNLLIGCVLAILLAVALLVAGPEKILTTLEMPGQKDLFNHVACYVIAAMIAMTNTAAVSLALEGKTIWLIKSLPIPSKILYDSYLLTNFTFTIPTSLICSTLFSISLKTEFITTILLFITPLIFSIFTGVAGIFIGNRLAYYDWQEEVQLIKQSMMSMLGILGGLILISLCGVVANSGMLPFTSSGITLVIDFIFLILAVVLYTKEINRPIK